MKNRIIFLAVLLTLGCKSDVDILQEVLVPSQVTLLFPEPNEICTTGEVISNTESEVVFEWTTAEVGDSYQVTLLNLNTSEESIYSAETNTLPIHLFRGVPYSWHVTTYLNNSLNTTSSETESFYNAGPRLQSHIPFPANYISPINNSSLSALTTRVTLEWEAEDLDGDIVGYDVYLENLNPPSLFESNIEANTLSNISVNNGMVYFWNIITKDSKGNESVSQTFKFSVDNE